MTICHERPDTQVLHAGKGSSLSSTGWSTRARWHRCHCYVGGHLEPCWALISCAEQIWLCGCGSFKNQCHVSQCSN